MCRQIQAKSKIVKMAWHIMACVIESKQICGFCGHKKSRPSQEGADGSCRRCTWSEQASRSFEAWVISRLRTFLMFLCTVCTSIQINHHHDYLFSLFCESMCALVYTYVYIYIQRERESLTRVWHVHGLHIWTHKCANADMWFTYMDDYGCMWDFLVARGKWALHQFCFYTHHTWMSLHVTSCGALFGTISRAVCTEHIDIFRAFTTSDIMW